MPDWEKLTQNLEKNGFEVVRFPTARQAAEYVDSRLNGRSIGVGGSMTVREMGLYPMLAGHNRVYWHWAPDAGADTQKKAAGAEVYLTSVNGLSETGVLVNIDGGGNRVSSTLCGHEEVWFLVGQNKIAPDEEGALWRARNIAAPKNAQRLGRKTPCALRGDKCYDCQSPQRICRGMVTLWRKPFGIPKGVVVLVEEDLGY